MHIKRVASNIEIGAAIKKRRQELTLSQEELAVKLHISSQQIQRYECGKDRLNVEKLQALAVALSVPTSYLLGKEPAIEDLREAECERELLSHYRKIQCGESKKMVLDLAQLLAATGG